MSDHFIQLNRNFLSISNIDDTESALDIETKLTFGIGSRVKWDDLLKEPRVVILAEAGAGKTVEIREITKRLRDKGNQAFFLRLEYLKDEFELSFEGDSLGEFSEFSSWIKTTEKAWFFLDSVDEAKLSNPSDFEKALRRFKTQLGDRIQNVNVVITSRPTWEPKTEFLLVKRLLPYHARQEIELSETAENPDDTIDSSGHASIATSEDQKQQPKVYSLAPLNGEQIKLFASVKGVKDTSNLLESINRADALLFAARPQDLTDLINFWNKHGRIGSRQELIKASVKEKLVETDPKRAEQKILTYKQALTGATLVAAATTLTPYSRVAVPERGKISEAIPITDILKEWELGQSRTLLERPIFDGAVYGTVRFHHRSVREYLTAQWFLQLLRKGSRRKVERLFFRELYGEELIPPSLRPILPWIALSDDIFREKVLRIAPGVLLEGGDPSQFPAAVRSDILVALCKEMATSRSRHYSFDIAAVERFACLDIEGTINRLLVKYHADSEIRTLLLRMVWQGKIGSCVKHAIPFVKDEKCQRYTRICAIRAIEGAGTISEKQDVVDYFVNTSAEINFSIIDSVFDSFGFRELSATNLLNILDRLPYPGEFKLEHLDYTLKDLMETASVSSLETFVEGLAIMLRKEPHVERVHCDISQQHRWLVAIAVKCFTRLINKRSIVVLKPDVLDLLIRCSNYRDYHSENDSPSLADLVPAWSDLNKRLFWKAVSRARVELDLDVPHIMQIAYHRTYWNYEVISLDRATSWIKTKAEMRDKHIAVSLAFKAYVREGRSRQNRVQLKNAVKGIAELESTLQNYLTPPPQTEEQKKWKRKERAYRRQDMQRTQNAEQREKKWQIWLTEHLDNIADTQLVKESRFYNSQLYLYERLRKLSTDGQGWTYSNWQDLIEDQNKEVAETFRDFLISCWRQYKPAIRSEGIENPNSIPYGIVFGLSGLAIEANDNSNWAVNLTAEEAQHAVRYSLWEAGNFPDWLQQLHGAFPDLVEKHFLREIKWELEEYEGEQPAYYVLDYLVHYGEKIQKKLSGSVMTILYKVEPHHVETLKKTISVVLASETIDDEILAKLAQNKIAQLCILDNLAVWYALLVSVVPQEAITHLKRFLIQLPYFEKPTDFAIKFVVNLIGGNRFHYRNARKNYITVEHLRSLYLLTHQYVRVADDINRSGGGVFSPGLRDDAQDARNAIFSQLQQIPGKPTYLALKTIAAEHPDKSARLWMQVHIRDRAEQDADIRAWKVDDVIDFDEDQETQPTNARGLYELSIERLLYLKDELEDGEDSVAATWQLETKETRVRILIAKWLRDHARGKYGVHQEEELADAKRPDIRIHGHGVDTPVPIELKIVDNGWSGKDIFERLENQLCNDYLRDYRTTFGIFLLVHRGEKKWWQHPLTKETLSFKKLLQALQQHAEDYIQDRSEIEMIEVLGLDLTARSKPVRFEDKDGE